MKEKNVYIESILNKAIKDKERGMGKYELDISEDAIEFIMAGADVVQVGTASFMNPKIALDIIAGIDKYLEDNNINNISEIRGII